VSDTYEERLTIERHELVVKHRKLTEFLASDGVIPLLDEQIELMVLQTAIMSQYIVVLTRRIELI
jgi:hypothetical protein